MSPGGDDSIEGIDTIEPSFGLPAKWITETVKEDAEILGLHRRRPAKCRFHTFNRSDPCPCRGFNWPPKTKQLIDHVRETYPILVDELTPTPLSIGEIQKVLAKLLAKMYPSEICQLSLKHLQTTRSTLPTSTY